MALPAGTAAFPLGFETMTILVGGTTSTDYKVNSVDIPSQTTRVINRPDENGDAADYQVREAGEKVTGTITLQRATLTTILPESGDTSTYDFDRSATASSLIVTDIKVSRSTDAADVFEISVLVDTYQG